MALPRNADLSPGILKDDGLDTDLPGSTYLNLESLSDLKKIAVGLAEAIASHS